MNKTIKEIFIIVVGGLILFVLQQIVSTKLSNDSPQNSGKEQTQNNQNPKSQNQGQNNNKHINEKPPPMNAEHTPQKATSENLIKLYSLKVEEINKRIINLPEGTEKREAHQIFSSIDKLFIEAKASGSLDSVTIILVDQLLSDLRKGRTIRKSLYMN